MILKRLAGEFLDFDSVGTPHPANGLPRAERKLRTSSAQLLYRLKEAGYTGGYNILKAFVQHVRPTPTPVFLPLHFAPGQAAQVDWGSAGFLPAGQTRRQLSYFVMVLCYSRKLYVEFTLAQTQEHFLACHQRAFEHLNGVPAEIMLDNCKTAILSHPLGQPAVPHPRYLDFAQHYGFTIKACGPRKAHEKGRVEKAVHYVKQSFLAGLQLSSLEAINAAARRWMDEVANVRVHGETRQQDLLELDLPAPDLSFYQSEEGGAS